MDKPRPELKETTPASEVVTTRFLLMVFCGWKSAEMVSLVPDSTAKESEECGAEPLAMEKETASTAVATSLVIVTVLAIEGLEAG